MIEPQPIEYRDANGRKIAAPVTRRKFGRSPERCRCRGNRTPHPGCPAHSELMRTTRPFTPQAAQVAIDNCRSDLRRRD